jgi:hypothetical protein
MIFLALAFGRDRGGQFGIEVCNTDVGGKHGQWTGRKISRLS